MARITEMQNQRTLLLHFGRNKDAVDDAQREVSTGIRVDKPGRDSSVAGTISQTRESLGRIDLYGNRISNVRGYLNFRDSVLDQTNQVLLRTRELAQQAANGTAGASVRSQIGDEVIQLRDQLVSLANSKYQDKYIHSGAADDTPPYGAATYTTPATGPESQRYNFTSATGTAVARTVKITDDLSVTVNTAGNQLFDNAIGAVERLMRALKGYSTGPMASDRSPTGNPDGTGTAYNLPAENDLQTTDIQNAMNSIATAMTDDIQPERSNVAGKVARLDTAETQLSALKHNLTELLGRIQDADAVVSASDLAQAQNMLNASLRAGAQILNNSILNYL